MDRADHRSQIIPAAPVQRRDGPAATPGKQTAIAALQRAAGGEVAGGEATVRSAAARGVETAASPLPHLDTIQRAFGRHDVSAIRAHVGGPAAQGAAQLGAQAYATGEQVAFAGPPDLHTAAHEVAHVVQQRAGVALADGVGQRGDAYEQRADAVADRVVAGESAEALLGDAPAGGAAAGHAVQRKVTVGDEARSYEELEPVVEQPRERLVLHAMVQEESTTYPFATPEELGRFVVNVAKTDWGPSPVDGEDPGARVATFATSQVGKHVWASDNRTGLYGQQELRVTRTNTLTKQFLRDKKLAKLEDNAHSLVGTVGNGAKLKQHVYSAMMTSLSPAASDEDRRQANDHVKPRAEQGHPGSVMNCEQFVAYSLWGGGVIQDWELALIFAACAQEGAMAFLYRAMGLDAATLVTPVTVPSELPQDPSTTTPEQRSLGLRRLG